MTGYRRLIHSSGAMEVSCVAPLLIGYMYETRSHTHVRSVRERMVGIDWSRIRLRRPVASHFAPGAGPATVVPSIASQRVRAPSPLGQTASSADDERTMPFFRLPEPLHEQFVPTLRVLIEQEPSDVNGAAKNALFDKPARKLECSPEHEACCTELEKMDVAGIRVPEEFCCPITLFPMRVPVVAEDGHTYDLDAIEAHFRVCSHRSPVTGLHLQSQLTFRNYALQTTMERWANTTRPGTCTPNCTERHTTTSE